MRNYTVCFSASRCTATNVTNDSDGLHNPTDADRKNVKYNMHEIDYKYEVAFFLKEEATIRIKNF